MHEPRSIKAILPVTSEALVKAVQPSGGVAAAIAPAKGPIEESFAVNDASAAGYWATAEAGEVTSKVSSSLSTLAATLVAPEQVEKVVLLDISPSPIHTAVSESGKVLDLLLQAPASASDRKELRDALTSRGLSAALADWLMMNVVNEHDVYRWRFDREALRDLHARVNQEDLWEAVERPGANVSCIRGGRSPYVSDADVQRLERAGCWVETLPNAGHYVHVEALDALLDLLSRED